MAGKKVKKYRKGGYHDLSPEEKIKFDTDAKAMGHTRKQHAAHTFPKKKGLKDGGLSGIFDFLGSNKDIIKDVSGVIGEQIDPEAVTPDYSNTRSAGQVISSIQSTEAQKTGLSLLKGTASGAASAGVPGAIVGFGAAALQRLTGSKQRKNTQTEIVNAVNQNYAQSIAEAGRSRFGYRKGGEIEGAGTSKSDSINAKIPIGSFLVPAENASVAMEIGQKLLGWKTDEKATIRQGGKEVDLSNNEVMFQPNEVKALESLGIDLNGLAPNAEPGRELHEGGPVGHIHSPFENTDGPRAKTTPIPTKAELEEFSKSKYGKALADELTPGTVTDVVTNSLTSSENTVSSRDTDLVSRAGTIAGGAQILGGIAGLITGDKPELPTVSTELNQLVTETAREAQYGLEPGERAQAERKIQRNVNTALKSVGSEFSGGPGSRYNRIVSILNQGNEAVSALAVKDEEIRRGKRREARGFKALRGQRKDYIEEFAFQDARQSQQLMGDVVTAGLDNIIGSVQYQEFIRARKEREKLNSSLIGA